MAGATLGFLKFVLGFDTLAFKKGMTTAEKDLLGFSKKIEKFGKGMSDIGAKMSLAITAPLIAFAATGIKEAQETAQAMALVNNALAQTGAVAGQTAPKLQAAADAFEMASLYEADEILAGVTSRMLVFGKILPQNFQAAQQAAIDFAAFTGKDLAAATTAVGKALQDPVKGLKALKEVGISLNADQIAQLQTWAKTGDAAKAQGFILDQLNTKIQNQAKIKADADPINKLTKAFKSLAEQLGVILLPLLYRLTAWATDMASAFKALDPDTQNLIITLAAIAAGVGPVLFLVGKMITMFAGVKTLVLFAQGLLGIGVAEGVVATGATAAGIAFRAMLGPLALIAAAVTAAYLAWKYWPQIVQFVKDVWESVSNYLGPKLRNVLNLLLAPINSVVEAFKYLYDKVVGHSYVPDMVDGIAAEMKRLDAALVEPVKKSTEAAKEAIRQLKTEGLELLRQLYPDAAARIEYERQTKALESLGRTAEQTAEALGLLRDKRAREAGILTDAEPLETESIAKFEPIGAEIEKIAGLNKDKTEEMAKAWGDMAVSAIGSMKTMVDAFKGGDILGGIQTLLDAVLNVIKALKSVGVFGGGAGAGGGGAGGLAFGGARALGGPVVPGKAYTVGEDGPEFFSTKRRGFIHPTGREAQPQKVLVVPSPYFDVVVDRRAVAVAAPMAGQAAVIGVTGSEARMNRRARRNLLAA